MQIYCKVSCLPSSSEQQNLQVIHIIQLKCKLNGPLMTLRRIAFVLQKPDIKRQLLTPLPQLFLEMKKQHLPQLEPPSLPVATLRQLMAELVQGTSQSGWPPGAQCQGSTSHLCWRRRRSGRRAAGRTSSPAAQNTGGLGKVKRKVQM